MQYLLDTRVLSDFVKGNVCTVDKIRSVSPYDIAVSSITCMEIEYGILRISGKKAEHIKSIMHEFISIIEILPLNKEVALEAAVIRSALHKQGSPIGAYNLLIGATAKFHQLVMVTGNIKEFERIEGLRIQNWSI